MKKLLIAPLIAVFLSSMATALPFQQITGEDAELFLKIRSLPELHSQWSEHPMAEIFKDEAVMKWFGDSGDDSADNGPSGFFEDIEETFGLTKDEFFELFSGQASLAFYNLSDQFLQNGEQLEFIVMAEFSGDPERLNELMQIQFERNAEMQKEANPLVEHELIEESFMGETLYFDETFNGETTYVEDGYAFVEGILILATPESSLREAVEMIKEGQEAPIANLELYQYSRDHSGRGDLSLYLNLRELSESLNTALENAPIYSTLAFFGITPQSLESALSLEVLQGLFLDFDLVEDGILNYGGILYSKKAGLLSLLEYVEGELPEARYVPDDVLSSSVTLFDISALYTSLEKILGAASPNILSMLDIQMQTIQSNTGVDLRSGLLENFGTQIVGFSVLKEDATVNEMGMIQADQVVIFDLKDAEAFGQGLNAIIDSVQSVRPLIEESLFEGETIYSIVTPTQPAGTELEVNYTITRSKFILAIGHISLLHNVLAEMENESDGFWQDPEIRALFERIEQPNAVTRTYYDAEQLIEPFFKLVTGMKGSGNDPGSLQFIEVPESLKGGYRLVSEGNETSEGSFWRTLIVKSEGDE